ncbi:Metaxin-3 [Borealophlyctis nickersoniae]|nr:Metaxin-3 [Borealophlyctis nickersoniae]
MLRDGTEAVVGTSRIILHLKKKDFIKQHGLDMKQGLDLDAHLSAHQRAESLGYISLVEDKMHDALLYTWWLEADNFAKSTRPTFSKALSWINRYYLPTQLREKARARLAHYGKITENGKSVSEVYAMARQCYAALAAKLGTKEYFFGSRPSTLDAVVFGHLALHCYPSLADYRLFSMLNFEFPTLVAYYNRLRLTLFSEPPRKSPVIHPTSFLRGLSRSPLAFGRSIWQSVQQWATPSTDEKARQHRVEVFQKVMSVIGGVAFFVAYVWYQGIVQIKIADESSEAEEMEYEEEDHSEGDDEQ